MNHSKPRVGKLLEHCVEDKSWGPMESNTTRQRRLAAIMFVDMVGYTAFANRNEAQALRSLKRLTQQIETVAGRYDGRNVKSLGDGFLLECPGTLAAVQCGLELHRSLRESSNNDEVDSSIHA